MSAPTIDQDRIDDMNEVIAIFDGYQFRKGDPDHKCSFCFAGDEPCAPAVDRFIKDCRGYFHFELKYHSSWDWLMCVWDKLRITIWREFEANYPIEFVTAQRKWKNYCAGVNLKVAHKTVYELCQWYNQQKEANNEHGTNE